jgi:tetratricopeptide (TPR) repeat protein
MIISRIDRLLGTDRHILQTASVIGRVFVYRILDGVYTYSDQEEALRMRLDYLGELGLTELQSPEVQIYQFKHLTTREVVYESLAFGQRRDFHRRIANFIERTYADTISEQIDLLAYHYFEGQGWAKAMEFNLMAARRAQHEFANDTAVSAYKRVLEAADKLDEEADAYIERLMAHESLGEVLTLLGRYDDALEHYAAARELVEAEPSSTDRSRHLADLCRKTAEVYERRSEYKVAFEWLHKGLSHLNKGEPTIEAARIYLLGAGVYHRQGKNDEAIDWCEKSLIVAAEIKTREGRQTVGNAYYLLGNIYTRLGDFRYAVQFCNESLRVYQQIDDIIGESNAYLNLGMVHSAQGDWDKAVDAYRKSLAMKKEIGDVFYQGATINNLANIQIFRGEWTQAAELLKQSYSIWKRVGATLPEGITLSNLAQIYIYQQDWDEALDTLRRSRAIFTETGSGDFLSELERRWGEFYLKTGELDQALVHARRSIGLAVKHEARLEEGMSCRMLGLIHLERGEIGPAEVALRKSLKTLTDLDSEYEAARTKLALARLLQKSSPLEAQPYLAEARATFEKLGAQADLAEAHAL